VKTETKDQLRDIIDMQEMEISQLVYIIRETMWMAGRYANMRSSYSPGMFNEALTLAYRLGVIDRKDVPYAVDGMFGTWNETLGRFNHDREKCGMPTMEDNK
jgi:hypothetical protein